MPVGLNPRCLLERMVSDEVGWTGLPAWVLGTSHARSRKAASARGVED